MVEVMGQEVLSTNDHNLKPQQSDDEDSDFPEFEFPVVGINSEGLPVTDRPKQDENSDGILLRSLSDQSPKKMPPATSISDENGDSGALQSRFIAGLSDEPTQPEVNKHVVTEDPTPAPASSAPLRKVLTSNPSFKSMMTLLGEPLKFRTASMERKANGDGHANGGEVTTGLDQNEESTGMQCKTVLSTTSSKRLSGIISRVNAKIAAQHQQPVADPASKTPERTRPSSGTSPISVNALVEKFSTGVRSKVREEAARALSPNPRPRNLLTSPRRTMADRSRSPTPLQAQLQDSHAPHPTTPRLTSSPRRGATVERSVSPVPRSWKNSVYGDMPKDRRPNLSKPDPATTPPPRFLSPTRAMALKAAKAPVHRASKSLQFTTAFGITTPVKQPTPTATRQGPTVTEPAGFNFRTDERAERRKDFNSKLEERLKVKEAERRRAEAKVQEEKESQLRELRKSLTYKANPVPKFYQEPTPAPAEIRKITPTRAKSPNFTAPRRRDSCPGSTVSEHFGNGRTSPLRSRTLMRCASLESNSGSHNSNCKASFPKPKLPFRPV